MPKHVLIGEYDERKRLKLTTWCGRTVTSMDWYFLSPGHVLRALRTGTSITACRGCLRAMRRVINKELGE